MASMFCGYYPAFRENGQRVGVFIQESAQLLFNNVNAVWDLGSNSLLVVQFL